MSSVAKSQNLSYIYKIFSLLGLFYAEIWRFFEKFHIIENICWNNQEIVKNWLFFFNFFKSNLRF